MKLFSFLKSIFPLFAAVVLCYACNPDYEDNAPNSEETETPTDGTGTDETSQKKSVEIRYTLFCGSNLLKYVIPEVTYTGENGNEQTFALSESDWEEDVYTTTSSGEKECVQYKWSKIVYFKQYSTSGRIAVNYIPQIAYEDMPYSSDKLGHEVYISKGREIIFNFSDHTIIGINSPAVANFIEKLSQTPDIKTFTIDDDGEVTIE